MADYRCGLLIILLPLFNLIHLQLQNPSFGHELSPPHPNKSTLWSFSLKNGGSSSSRSENKLLLKPHKSPQLQSHHPSQDPPPLSAIKKKTQSYVVLHACGYSPPRRSRRQWPFCPYHSALLRECPSSFGQRLHHHRCRCHCSLSEAVG